VLAVSDGLRKEMIDLLALRPEMCRTIYNPVEIGRIRTLAREPVEAFVADSGLPVVVTCGRLILLKNHRLLLKAFRDVQARQPSRLVILGEGPERPALEALAQELGIAEHVSFLGFQANPFKFMARAVVFALSSDTEAFPCVIQEAMACGVPVISADCDYGPREIITDGRNGLLVPPGDQAALTAAIVRVHPDAELRARLAAEASRTVLRYDAPAVTRQYESLFDEVLAKSGRGGGA
jgi:glycosyltransferase involved in cell wall biosynthesis